MLTRRTFIASGAGSCLLAALPKAAVPSRRVAVVGAGLAGLTAAYELKRTGFDVVLLERSTYAGGRVRTVRDFFADGAWVDVGAQTVGSSYTNLLAYCRHFGLRLVPHATEPPPARDDKTGSLVVLGGRTYRQAQLRKNPQLWPLQPTAAWNTSDPGRLLSRYLMPVAHEIAHPTNLLDAAWSHYDGMTLYDFLRRSRASEDAIEVMAGSLSYSGLDSISALSALRDATRLLNKQTALRIQGGNDRLPRAMAARLRDELCYETEVFALEQRDDGVRLHTRRGGVASRLDADRVILALPFTALRRIDIMPTLPRERSRIIDELPYTQVAHTYVQTRSRFWERPDNITMIYTDTAYERIFDTSRNMRGRRGLLLNWMNGESLLPFMDLSDEDHAATVVERMRGLWPDRVDEFETALTTNWANSYAGGAYAHYAPGQLQRWATLIPQPIGRLHFAGEHTELVAPGMEGAIISGLRAAKEVADRPMAV